MIVTICLVFHDPLGLLDLSAVASQGIVILYLGPETMMPLASALAGIVGAALMFWQRLARWARKLIAYLRTKMSLLFSSR